LFASPCASGASPARMGRADRAVSSTARFSVEEIRASVADTRGHELETALSSDDMILWRPGKWPDPTSGGARVEN
jgi:hypothetical protein